MGALLPCSEATRTLLSKDSAGNPGDAGMALLLGKASGAGATCGTFATLLIMTFLAHADSYNMLHVVAMLTTEFMLSACAINHAIFSSMLLLPPC